MARNDPNSPTSVKRTTTAIRREEALKYRIAGLTFQRIADNLGITKPAAHGLVMTALKEHKRQTDIGVDLLREKELQTLDVAQVAIWQAVMQGDGQAINNLLKIMERRAKYLGLDSPPLTSNVNVDLNSLSLEQLDRIANGEPIFSVIASTG